MIGSRYYVEHPSYPLTRTLAALALDMVGAGEETLYACGTGSLARDVMTMAHALGLSTALRVTGRTVALGAMLLAQ